MTPVQPAVVKFAVRAACVGLGSMLAGPLGTAPCAFVGDRCSADVFAETVAGLAAGPPAGLSKKPDKDAFLRQEHDSLASRLARRPGPPWNASMHEAFSASACTKSAWKAAISASRTRSTIRTSPSQPNISPDPERGSDQPHQNPGDARPGARPAVGRLDARDSAVHWKDAYIGLHPRPRARTHSSVDDTTKLFETMFKSLDLSPNKPHLEGAVLAAKNKRTPHSNKMPGHGNGVEGGSMWRTKS